MARHGANRLSAGRLYQIAQALGVDISYFFEDIDPEKRNKPKPAEMMPQQRMLLELARNFIGMASRPSGATDLPARRSLTRASLRRARRI